MHPDAQKEALECLIRHNRCVGAGIGFKPKHHFQLHMAQSIAWKGNCRMFHTYCDESLNKVLVTIAAGQHRATMERLFFFCEILPCAEVSHATCIGLVVKK